MTETVAGTLENGASRPARPGNAVIHGRLSKELEFLDPALDRRAFDPLPDSEDDGNDVRLFEDFMRALKASKKKLCKGTSRAS